MGTLGDQSLSCSYQWVWYFREDDWPFEFEIEIKTTPAFKLPDIDYVETYRKV